MPKKIGVLRYETLFGCMTPIIDVSDSISTVVIPSYTDLVFFKLDSVIEPDDVFIGFGKPNVYIGMPDGKGGVDKFDAKSLKRSPSRIINTKGLAQSGLLFNLMGLPEDAIREIREAAESEVGSKQWTCVNANARVLQKAGFHLKDKSKSLDSFYFPMPFAEEMTRNGIYYRGTRVEIRIIRTVNSYLERFGWSVVKSQWLTLCRHTERFANKKSKILSFGVGLIKAIGGIFKRNKNDISQPLEEVQTLFPECREGLSVKHKLEVTHPSDFGLWLRYKWGPHSLFKITPENNPIDLYLPESLIPYGKKEKTLINFVKQRILFAPPVVSFMREHLTRHQTEAGSVGESDLFNMLRTHTDNIPNKYNVVATNNKLIIMKIGIKYKSVDWVLSKHILCAGYSDDVRFAGEIFKSPEGRVFVNNNSGTFTPSEKHLDSFIEYLRLLFPNIEISKAVN